MWRAFIILLLSIGILGGGFYYFASNEGWFDKKEPTLSESDEINLPTDSSTSTAVTTTQDEWLDYKYQQNGVLFASKYPAADWKTVEQLNGDELSIIFTNNDSCQVMYLFDIRQGQYKSELSNNKNSESCAEILRKIVSIATIPQFGVTMTEESETQADTNSDKSQDGVAPAELAMTDEPAEDSTTVKESVSTDSKDSTSEPVKPIVAGDLSVGVSDQEINEMSSQERYDSVKAFVNNYLLEYAKRRWATLESQLSAKAKSSLGGKTLAEVATPFYYYELLTVLKSVSLTQYQVNVKLTTKEETPVGSGDGVYTLNIVWEYGDWKIDNYLFE
ncbi:MAG TPA: hypothetical protein PLB38_03180 [bacterium]|nr:hypothetical protein [bacterium]